MALSRSPILGLGPALRGFTLLSGGCGASCGFCGSVCCGGGAGAEPLEKPAAAAAVWRPRITSAQKYAKNRSVRNVAKKKFKT